MVYVHKCLPCKPNKNWPYSESTHLIADTCKELYEFAGKLKLKREWIQNLNNNKMPHYDLTPNKHAEAIRKGAIELTLPEFGAKLRKYREDRKRLKEIMEGCK